MTNQATTEPGNPRLRVFAVFYISLLAISAELCLALMLSLKAFSHMVYVVISFALLGYGIGSNLYLLLRKRIQRFAPDTVAGLVLVAVSVLTVATARLLPGIPITLKLIYEWNTILSLTLVYLAVALPFVAVGFLISLVFSSDAAQSRKLYFWDLAGAGLGTLVFFALLSAWGPIRVLVVLALVTLAPAALLVGFKTRARQALVGVVLALALVESVLVRLPEPDYAVDPEIGWEYIPGRFAPEEYQEVWRKWHPLGRTDLHRMRGLPIRTYMVREGYGVFEICVEPTPEFSYFTNCYRAGTPVFGLDEELMRKEGCQVKPFSQPMECPYVVLDKPRVVVIGSGGGRDLFMAGVHQAKEILGAEINPATYEAMSPGGIAYDYSGRVYTAGGTQVYNIDGRHLVRNRPTGAHDLIILNGIDTFAALSTGAYAFAENYLYTHEAIVDYLRILSPNGIINFNRWLEHEKRPRETLRLFIMALEALRNSGAKDPGRHVIIGRDAGWAMMLVKRTPFTFDEEKKLYAYFEAHDVGLVYSPSAVKNEKTANPFDVAVAAYRQGFEKKLIADYWADISVVHDDNPFFYKYYRFQLTDTLKYRHAGGGLTAFHVQAFIVVQSIIFILVFIFLPLRLARTDGQPWFPRGKKIPFVLYFAALGAGFIFIEITLMQRFTLALGSPIYSISVTLATILIATGVGSLLSERFIRWAGYETRMIQILSILVVLYLAALVAAGTALLNLVVQAPFAARVAFSAAILTPIGICLGVFFPSGLALVGGRSPNAVAWAWGINSGFTVLGSTMSIFIAQFLGFNVVLMIAACLYLIAALAFRRLAGDQPASPAALLPAPPLPPPLHPFLSTIRR
ncbi:MAG: hypothetical protein HY293_18725 [Planctomycetes bacterium]|nr:hypothetical protein [Planctomycetota bacterium]